MTKYERKKREEEERKNRMAKPLQMMKRRLLRRAGVLLEIQEGTPENYDTVIKECQKRIVLDELGIPLIGIKKVKGGNPNES